MSVLFPTEREAEAIAADSQVPSMSSAEIVMADCVGAVTKWDLVELADDDTEAGIQLPASEGNRCFGVTLKTGIIGDRVPVQTGGLGFVRCGATLTAPDALQGATDGDAIAAATSDIVAADLLADGEDGDVRKAYIYGPRGYVHA